MMNLETNPPPNKNDTNTVDNGYSPKKLVVYFTFVFYGSEVITILMRSSLYHCTPFGAWIWFVPAFVQLMINFMFTLILIWDNVSYTQGGYVKKFLALGLNWVTCIPFLAIQVIVLIEAVKNWPQHSIRFMSLLINIFGYYPLLRFWQAIKNVNGNLSFNESERWFLGFGHACFTGIIIALSISGVVLNCDDKLSLIESQLELFLNGYIAAIIDWERTNLPERFSFRFGVRAMQHQERDTDEIRP